jgi:hypothetical protein
MAASLNQMVRYSLLVLATALVMLWPAYTNKSPFWFPDTSSYVRAADAGAAFVTGKHTEWSDRLATERTTQARIKDGAHVSPAPITSTRPVLLGRSIYYGMLIYVPMMIAGPWAAAFLQSLLASALLILCISVALSSASHRMMKIVGIVGALAAVTPLPFYAAMLMPDIFAGLLILVLATLFGCWDRLQRWQALVIVGAACVLVTFHTTILLLAIVMGFAGILFLPDLRARGLGACAMLAIIGAGVGSTMAFSMAIEKALHQPPISPPFLSARMTATGPGLTYLRKSCARDAKSWALCAHLPNLPQAADVFLWSVSPTKGIFQIADGPGQRLLAKQDKAFMLRVLTDDPLGVAAISIRSTLEQLSGFDYENFNYNELHISLIPEKYPPAIAASISGSRAALQTMPTALAERAAVIASALALVVTGWALVQGMGSNDEAGRRFARLALLIVLGILANAAFCGALSGPHARYQMRLIWLLPLVAMLVPAMSRRVHVNSSILDNGGISA